MFVSSRMLKGQPPVGARRVPDHRYTLQHNEVQHPAGCPDDPAATCSLDETMPMLPAATPLHFSDEDIYFAVLLKRDERARTAGGESGAEASATNRARTAGEKSRQSHFVHIITRHDYNTTTSSSQFAPQSAPAVSVAVNQQRAEPAQPAEGAESGEQGEYFYDDDPDESEAGHVFHRQPNISKGTRYFHDEAKIPAEL
eukprot:g10390.t1